MILFKYIYVPSGGGYWDHPYIVYVVRINKPILFEKQIGRLRAAFKHVFLSLRKMFCRSGYLPARIRRIRKDK